MAVDQTDLDIIRELQEDGRMSLREIGRKLGLAEATIRLRIRRLHEAGILQIVAFADPTKLGNSSLALLFAAVDPAAHDAVVAELTGWTEVSYLSSTLGDSNLCVQIVCRDLEALWAMRQRIAALPGVQSVRVLNEVRVHKLRFSSPVKEEFSEGDL